MEAQKRKLFGKIGGGVRMTHVAQVTHILPEASLPQSFYIFKSYHIQ
jgi:hypothetical protein